MNHAPLLDLILTEEERIYVLDLLDRLRNGFFMLNETSESPVFNDPSFGRAIYGTLPENFNSLDPNSKSKLVQELIDEVNNIPTAEIIVAAPPTKSTTAALYSYVKERAGEKSVIKITIDPSVLGGAIFIINGKYIDLSVVNKLNQAFSDKEEVKAILDMK